MKKQGRSIFHTIFLAMLSVLFIETLLLLIVLYLSRVGERLNQNAIDLLQKQVENRSSYLESVMLDNQNLSSLSDKINTAAESLRESGLIDMEHLGDNSNACLPLMEAIDSDLIEELRSHSATGLFVLFNTQDLSRREIHSDIPCIYLRDLDPDAPASDRNADLLLLRAPAAMVKSMGISTDRAWTPALSYRGLGTSGILYPSFQAAYEDHAQLSASDYGHWTITSYTLTGDDHPAIAYTIPLILSDGTVYGVLGIEMTTAYLQSLLPFWELQNEQAGSYLLASHTGNLQDPEVSLSAACCSTGTGMEAYNSEDTLLLTHKNRQQFLLINHGKRYYAALAPLSFYNRNAPFSSEQWLLIGSSGVWAAVFLLQPCDSAARTQHSPYADRRTDLQSDLQPQAGTTTIPPFRGSGCCTEEPEHDPEPLSDRHPGTGSVLNCDHDPEPGYSDDLDKIFADHGYGQCRTRRLRNPF